MKRRRVVDHFWRFLCTIDNANTVISMRNMDVKWHMTDSSLLKVPLFTVDDRDSHSVFITKPAFLMHPPPHPHAFPLLLMLKGPASSGNWACSVLPLKDSVFADQSALFSRCSLRCNFHTDPFDGVQRHTIFWVLNYTGWTRQRESTIFSGTTVSDVHSPLVRNKRPFCEKIHYYRNPEWSTFIQHFCTEVQS